MAFSPSHIESSLTSNSESFSAVCIALKSTNSLYCGSDDAISCPSQLRMLPRTGAVLRLSTFTRSATCIQKSCLAVMMYKVLPSTATAISVISMAIKLNLGIAFLLSNLLILLLC